MKGNGCAGSTASGKHRKDAAEEIFLEPLSVCLGDDGGFEDGDADALDLGAKIAPAPKLLARQQRDELGDLGELFGRREAILGAGGHAGAHLPAQAGDAHHEEFIEIIGRNRQKAQLLQ